MGKRNSIPQKIRFEIFKRDNFVCQYCGRQTPTVVLEVDHIVPVAEGGIDDPANLVTSCFDCNRGKGKVKLSKSSISKDRSQDIAELTEMQEQIKEYEKQLRKKQAAEKRTVTRLCTVWSELCDWEYAINESGRQTIKTFLKSLTYSEIKEAMEISAARVSDIEGRYRYMCGVCHNKIAEKKGDLSKIRYRKAKNHWLKQKRGSGYFVDYKLKEICATHDEADIFSAIDEAHACPRRNYWDAFMEILGEDE